MNTVLITGSSTGIGKVTALFFQQKGWNVAATMRTPSKEKELPNLERVICPKLDVLDNVSIKTAIAETIEKFGRIDVVVNNAGYGLVGPFEASTDEQIKRQFDTNVFGIMNVTRAILPHFRENQSGVIINVASMGGRLTFPLYSLYHGTKWAVEGFSEALQYELDQFNIRVKIVEPGAIKTDFYDRSQDLMKKEGLIAYDTYVNRIFPKLQDAGAQAIGPEVVAKKIYRAATDHTKKVRYPVGSGAPALLFMRRLLPTHRFNGIVRMVVGK